MRARAEIERFRGRVVKSTGDEVLATFDGPGRSIRCAVAMRESVRLLGIDLRAGLHTGEIEVLGDDIAGMAFHIGARVSGLAGAGEVLVSSTVKDLVAGSGMCVAPDAGGSDCGHDEFRCCRQSRLVMDHGEMPAGFTGTPAPGAASGRHESHGSTAGEPLDGRHGVAELDVSWLVDVDLAVVDALARLQLAARRSGVSLHLHGPCPLLSWWLDRAGLIDVIGICHCGVEGRESDEGPASR